MTIYAILGIGLALWGFGLWSRGFFGSQTSSLDRWAYVVRNLFWFGSILIIAWPLQLYRESIGDVAYVAIAAAILALFFGLGIIAARRIMRRQEQRQ